MVSVQVYPHVPTQIVGTKEKKAPSPYTFIYKDRVFFLSTDEIPALRSKWVIIKLIGSVSDSVI